MPQRKTIPFPRREIPPLALVNQKLSNDRIANVSGDVKKKLIQSEYLNQIKNGARIAITAGSRGMGAFTELLGGICDAVREKGGEPFLVPAMGSHGGATEKGQIEILHRLGVDEEKIGAKIVATMHTHALGICKSGAIAHLDDIAANADGIIVFGRTKTHPENSEGIASGLLKMVTVGLGKQAGAQEAHSHGLWDSVKKVPEITMAKAKILCGVAVVENAFRQPVQIEIVAPKYEAFKKSDRNLLKIAQKHVADLPFQQLDLLIVDELGKDISGTGMDLNVIGKWRMEGGKTEPDFHRIAVLSLTYGSFGNGLGIGLADFTTERFVRDFNSEMTYVNLLTATEPGVMNTKEGLLPIALPTDKEAIETALFSSLASAEHPRVCRIKNTAELNEFWISAALVKELESNENFRILEKGNTLKFDKRGNLF